MGIMMNDRISRGGLLLLLAAGLAGLAVFILLQKAAFPVASLELEVDRAGADERAARFVADRGIEVGDREHSVTFGSDGSAAVFLQRTLDPSAANQAMAEFPIYRWEARWFRSEEKEEVQASVGLRGEVIRYAHLIPEAQAGATVDLAAARALAENFLTQVIGLDLARIEEVDISSEKLEQRTDHVLEWRVRDYELRWRDDPEAGTGTLRHRVRIQGDEVGLYEYDYRVPEGFEREVQAITSRGLLLTIISFAFMVVLGLTAVVLLVKAIKHERIAWRASFGLGAAVFAATVILALNTWPQIKAQYVTQIPYPVYLGMRIVLTVIIALVYGLLVLICAAAGELETRRREAAKGALTAGAGGRRFGVATVYGYSFAAIFLGYVTLFYFLARRYLGVWMPAEGPYSEILSTAVPFLAPLSISIAAGISEEVTFRFFAVSFLARALGGRGLALAVALLLPAAVWAFAHSSYPVFPVWVRGVELTIAGIAFGILFLRVGIVAAIIAHYVIDAVFLSAPLITSGNPSYMTAGIAVVALAAAPGVAALLTGRRHAAAPTAAPPTAAAPTAAPPTAAPSPGRLS
jgi:hypothetical protein